MQTSVKQEVKPILKGILEYSGYGAVNGYYVLLSHPHIQTEDGYVLHTMYCHLKKPLVKFSSYQKMLREISLGSYPLVEISDETIIGYVGNSGLHPTEKNRLYLQCDFRKYDHKTIVIDPMKFYRRKDYVNSSADMICIEEFKKQR
jgi:murein DD-endopeptidase MepM/ murein hydrolase activator NlpD